MTEEDLRTWGEDERESSARADDETRVNPCHEVSIEIHRDRDGSSVGGECGYTRQGQEDGMAEVKGSGSICLRCFCIWWK